MRCIKNFRIIQQIFKQCLNKFVLALQENNRLKTEAEAIPLGRMKELRREIEKLPKELMKLREENESIKALMDKLPQILEKHKFATPREEVSKIELENGRLREENEVLRFEVESLSRVKEENIGLREEIERLECERLQRLKSKIQKLPQDIFKPREENDAIEPEAEKVPQTQEENVKLREEIERLKSQLKAATDKSPSKGASSKMGKKGGSDKGDKEMDAAMEEPPDYCWYSNFLGIPVAFPHDQHEL